jgi:hypothetical protein
MDGAVWHQTGDIQTMTKCYKCGRDISQSYKFYADGEHPYCYECSEEWKRINRPPKEPDDVLTRMITNDYKKRHIRPSELAVKYHMSTKEIYERLLKNV